MIAQYAKEVVLGLEAGELGHVGVGVVVARELLERRAEAELGRQRREVIVVDAQHDELAHLRDVVRDRDQLVVAEIETQQREREERRRHLRELVVAEIEHLEEEQRAERRRQRAHAVVAELEALEVHEAPDVARQRLDLVLVQEQLLERLETQQRVVERRQEVLRDDDRFEQLDLGQHVPLADDGRELAVGDRELGELAHTKELGREVRDGAIREVENALALGELRPDGHGLDRPARRQVLGVARTKARVAHTSFDSRHHDETTTTTTKRRYSKPTTNDYRARVCTCISVRCVRWYDNRHRRSDR